MTTAAKRFRRALRVPFEWIGIGLGVALMANLTHRGLFRLCDFLSAVMYRFDRRGRAEALYNLRAVLGRPTPASFKELVYAPSAAEEKVIRRSYRNMARAVGHAFWTCRDAVRRVKSVGAMSPECAAFLAAHRPAVAVSGHIGCWEILSQLAQLEGHRMMSVAKDIGTGGMTRLLIGARESIGQEIVPAEGAFKPLLAGLRAGKSLGLLVDQVVKPKQGGVWVRFFGRPVPVSAAPAFFAAKCRVPILVAWSRPLKDGSYRCERVADYPPEAARDIWGMTQRTIRDLERVIRRHPSCWVLNYNAFRRKPTAEELAELAKREEAAP